MRCPHFSLCLSLCLLLAACGGGVVGGPSVPPQQQAPRTYFVDAAQGDDSNPGTAAEPLQTITHALAVVRPESPGVVADDIRVHAGLYDANRETFPLVIPDGVRVANVVLTQRPEIVGGGALDPQDAQNLTAAVVLRSAAWLTGFQVTNSTSTAIPGIHVGIVAVGDLAEMERLTVSGSAHGGIRAIKGRLGRLTDSEIFNHPNGIGLYFASGEAYGRVQGCDIHDNKIGIEYDAAGPLLGGDLSYSRAVHLHGNSHTDLWVAPGVSVDARYNFWDHAPPTVTPQSNLGGGVDFYHLNGVLGVDTTGASLHTP